MEDLISKFRQKLNITQTEIIRDFMFQINWGNRFTGIKGARGTGKTTLLLQYIKLNVKDLSRVLYVSLDDLYFRKTNLYNLANEFHKYGGELLVLDEVHRYSAWSEELKVIYDDMPALKVIFTGSSIIEISKAKADLSRRAVVFELRGLSFREYLRFQGFSFKQISLDDIFKYHTEITLEICKGLKPLYHFNNYLQYGYYPYFLEGIDSYKDKLSEVINLIIDNDLETVYNISFATTEKLKQFLMVLAESVPFTPNISKLADRMGVSRNVIIDYLYWLEQSRLITKIHREGKVITSMQKPARLLLQNPNLTCILTEKGRNFGTLKETFFISQLSFNHHLNVANHGDFLIDNQYVVEIGGSGKSFSQIKDIPDSYLALDGIETGTGKKIPLWLFGLIY